MRSTNLFGPRAPRRGRFDALAGVLALAALLLALALQHGFDMQPCAWCVLQRLVYLLIALLALAAFWRPRAAVPLEVLALALVAAGVVAALYQQFVASSSLSCALTLADRIVKGLSLDTALPWMFKATAFCDEANVPLLGVPFAVWSALAYLVLGTLLAAALVRSRARR